LAEIFVRSICSNKFILKKKGFFSMASNFSITFMDNSRELSVTGVNIPTITSGNFGTILTGGEPAALAAAIKAVSLCTPVQETVSLSPIKYAAVLPSSAYAQRELALRVSYQDNTTLSKYTFTVPGVDWAVIGLAGTDKVDETNELWTSLVSAFEAGAVSPDGNAVSVLGGRLVGRNN
jgi:hypothetical protein